MKLHCHRPSLAAALGIVQGVVPTRTPKEILKNVKLTATKDSAILIGTDQEVGIRYEIQGVEVEQPGETLLPTSRVASILRELTDETVYLELSENTVSIKSGHSEFKLSAEDAAEFPAVTAFDEKQYHLVPGKVLRESIRRTIFATDVESTRYALGGVLLELESEGMNLVATDSRRLALVKTVCKSQGMDEAASVNPVIPAKAMGLIEKSISEEEDEVLIAVHANDVLVKAGRSTIYSRLVEGRFPRYRDVVPQQATATIELVVGPFYSAVRQAQIVTNEESRGVDFKFADGLLTLSSQAAEIGQSKVELPIGYDGEAIVITFDPRFVADFLKVLEPESQVELRLIDSESAAVLRAGENYTYVIMPLSRER